MYNKEIILKEQPNYLSFWITVFIIFLTSLYMIIFYKFTPYYVITGIYDKEVGNVSFVLENDKLSYIKYSKIKINNQLIDNDILEIGDYVYLDNEIYNSVFIPLSIDIDEQLVNISFELPKTTILKRIWKGMIE